MSSQQTSAPHERTRRTQVDLAVYELDAVLKSAYRFTGRCYLHLQTIPSNNAVEVWIRPKRTDDDPDAALGEFLNDLLDQRLRSIVAFETAGVRDLVMAHALSRTTFVRPDLETAEPREDSFHVAIPDKSRVPAT